MIRKSAFAIILLIVAGFSLAVAAESYRFDSHLADARQVTVTPPVPGVGRRPFFSPEGPLAWRPSGSCVSSQVKVEGDRLVLITEGADCLYSPKGLDADPVNIGCLEIELCVTGQDTVQVGRGFLWDMQPCVVAVPQQGQFFTARIDPREQNGWMYPRIQQMTIGVKGPARLEIRAVREVQPLLVAPLGTRPHRIKYGDSIRQTLFAHCPVALEYTLRVPQHGFFTAGLGISTSARPVGFQVDVRVGGATTQVLAHTVETADAWADVEADLSAFAGQEVTMTLSASCDVPGQVALWSNPAVLERRVPDAHARPNILFYVIDALRCDHLDVYGYPRKTAPEVTAFAEGGVRFAWCFSQGTWTPVSVPSFHMSLGPLVHKIDALFYKSIPPTLVTFPEVLREAGYTTGVVTDNGMAPPQTLPRVSYGTIMDDVLYPPPTTTERIGTFLEANRDRSFFLYVHTTETHSPKGPNAEDVRYGPPAAYRGTFSSGSAPTQMDYYDECILWASREFGNVLGRLASLGLAEDTIVILSADHGEAFGEHGNDGHCVRPYIEVLCPPLVMSWPGKFPAGKVVNETVSLLDVAPTILDYAGVPIPQQFQGMSLRGLVEGGDARAFQERTVFAWGVGTQFPAATDALAFGAFAYLRGVVPGLSRFLYDQYYKDVFRAFKMPWALFREYPNGPTELYNLALDRNETRDVASQNPEIVKAMSEQIEEYRRREAELGVKLGISGSGQRDTFDTTQMEALESLGYLGRK